MTKNELINDMDFRSKCGTYELCWENFDIYEDIIILNSPKKDILVLLDENYNTIGIAKIESASPKKTIEECAITFRNLYNYVGKDDRFILPYPFQNLSLKQIVEISNRIFIYKNYVSVNGKCVTDKKDNVYILLLSYIKFLGEQTEQYFLNAYQMKMMGFDYPEVHSYVKSLVNNINECINENIREGDGTFPIDIIEYLGQDRNNVNKYDVILCRIIDLLLEEKGFKIIGGIEHHRELEPIEKREIDLGQLSLNLLKILEVSKYEVNEMIQKGINSFEIEGFDLQSWLEEDLCKIKKLKNYN